MSFAEIKERVADLTPEERLELAGLIAHLSRTDDLQYQAELERRLARMDAGTKHDSAELLHLHNELSVKGK